ncbi:Uma2 family endonuclease [Larkinella soli]|uniref:Uma2 family endonuclease n=1 Tax=Larkinella soli TaxID=1770527 RepID=UPI000FFBD32A|nr:Uma2 family endonuclease [Larkinella soli]
MEARNYEPVMTPELKKHRYTFEEYEALEQEEGIRYEYDDGEIYAMAGTTFRHNLLVQNIGYALRSFAKIGGCRVFVESIKQKLTTGEKYVYPDIIYTCEPNDWKDDQKTVVKTPTLLIEVVSKSSEKGDTETKRLEYTKLPSLLYYLIVHQARYAVQVFERAEGFWKLSIYEGLSAVIDLPLLGITLPLADIYEGIPENPEKEENPA